MVEKAFTDHAPLLYESILQLQTPEECALFLSDLCTTKEIGAMAQRLAVAKMLEEGYSYAEIVEKTGASTATVSRVKRSSDHYRIVLQRVQEKAGNK